MAISDYHSTYDEEIGVAGNREDLGDVIFDVSPTETPFATAAGKNRATGTKHDWLTDKLEIVAVNTAIEGADSADASVDPRTRLTNYTQILTKHPRVTGTQEKVLKGGSVKSEMAYQVGRRMKAIKRDLEHACVGLHTGYEAGIEGTTARQMAGLSAYLVDENFQADAGATPPTGDGSDEPTGGTNRGLTDGIFKTALSALWGVSGGNENVLAVCNAHQRAIISSFDTAGSRYVTTDDKVLVDSIDIYDGDFHTVTVTADRFCHQENVFIVDPEFVKLSDLRPLHSFDLAKNGDSHRKQLVWETTLEVCNPQAHVNIHNLTGPA